MENPGGRATLWLENTTCMQHGRAGDEWRVYTDPWGQELLQEALNKEGVHFPRLGGGSEDL